MTIDLDTLDLAALTRRAEALGYVRDADPDDGLPWGRVGIGGGVLCVQGECVDVWWSGGGVVVADEAAALRWLLRQPEAVARAAVYARGVAGRPPVPPTMSPEEEAEVGRALSALAGAQSSSPIPSAEYARGVADERAWVVAWLRDMAALRRARAHDAVDDGVVDALDDAADAIEIGGGGE